MTGTESVYPKGQLRFTAEVAGQQGAHGTTVQTFVEAKCQTCGDPYEIDLQHVTKKDEALRHVGEAWGLCKSCMAKERSRYPDYGMEWCPRMMSQDEAQRLYPKHPGDQIVDSPYRRRPKEDRIQIGLRGNLVGNKVITHPKVDSKPEKDWYVGVSHPSDFEDLKRPLPAECKEPDCALEPDTHFHYNPTILHKKIQIGGLHECRHENWKDVDSNRMRECLDCPMVIDFTVATIAGAYRWITPGLKMKDEASFHTSRLERAYDTLHRANENADRKIKEGPEELFKHWGITGMKAFNDVALDEFAQKKAEIREENHKRNREDQANLNKPEVKKLWADIKL